MTTGDTVSSYSNGSIHYKEVRKLSRLDVASFYKGYPIYRLFKVVDSRVAKTNEPTGAGWTPYTYQEYWNPFPEYTKEYLQYSAGDEYATQSYSSRPVDPNGKDPSGIEVSGIGKSNAQSKPIYSFAQAGTSRLFMGDIYKVTPEYVLWEELKKTSRTLGDNPYSGANVQVWVRVFGTTETSETGITYWYNPLLNKFFIIQPAVPYLVAAVGNPTQDSLKEGKILGLIAQGNTRAQAMAIVDPQSRTEGGPGAGGAGAGTKPPVPMTNRNGSLPE